MFRLCVLLCVFLGACGDRLSREDYKYFDVNDCRLGINQNPDEAVQGQCEDARNVWAPNGIVEQRPGYVGHASLAALGSEAYDDQVFVKEVSGVFTSATSSDLDVSNLAVGSRWYFGFNLPADYELSKISGAVVTISTANSNATWTIPEYWNGSRWQTLSTFEYTPSTPPVAGNHLSNASSGAVFLFVPPDDWSRTTVDSRLRYWIRFTIQGAALDASTSLTDPSAFGLSIFSSNDVADGYSLFHSLAKADFGASGKRYLLLRSPASLSSNLSNYNLRALRYPDKSADTLSNPRTRVEPMTVAVVPEFGVAYAAYNNFISQFFVSEDPSSANIKAAVNSNPDFVGTGAPYDPAEVAQLSSFPAANYLLYHQGLLWASGIKDEQFTVRWSGPAIDGAYNIWPENSFEILSESDNSPITGLAALGEHVVVFKGDSIWLMIPNGLDDLDLPSYRPVKVVSGVGAVSQGSIQAVKGKLVFLAEDGIYAFDGTPNVQKLSGPVSEMVADINPAQLKFSTAVNWTTQDVYLLSVARKGSDVNNFVFVLDYDKGNLTEEYPGAWWFWDDIEAQAWLLDEGMADTQILYFANSKGHVFHFGVQDTNNGGTISSYIKSHNSGLSRRTLSAREVYATAYQDVGSLSVTLYTNDEPQTARTLSFASSNEATYGTAVYGTDTYVPEKRRERRLDYFQQTGRKFATKIANSTKGRRMRLESFGIGWLPFGRR